MHWGTSLPAWYPDPGRAHESRYVNSSNWTDDVSEAAVVSQAHTGYVANANGV
jgi:hypothetical protein